MKKPILSLSFLLAMTVIIMHKTWGKDLPGVNQRLYSDQNGLSVVVGSNKTVLVDLLPGAFTDDPIKDVVTLGVDQTYPTYFPTAHKVTVTLKVNTWKWNNGLVEQPEFYITLTIDYHPLDNGIYRDKQSYSFKDAYKVKFTVTNILVDNNSQTTLPGNLYIDGTIYVSRWYDFTGTAPVMLALDTDDVDCDDKSYQIKIKWEEAPDAEEYQLEWTFVNDYYGTPGDYITDLDKLQYDFRNNATRITTTNTFYTIPRLFDHGWLVWRVRSLGRTATSPHLTLYGHWSLPDADESGSINDIQSYPLSNLNLSKAHEQNKNWQLTTTFAEEGKKKEVINYFDGSLRNRQTVTELNSDNNIIAGQTIYDYQGRPAVTALPVPVGGLCDFKPVIKYYEKFNQDGSGNEYSKDDFDTDNDPCGAQAGPMSTSSGASRYYSEDNPDKTNFQAFVPDAQQYPFSEVEYTPDNTGRIRRQSGVGPDFKLGSHKETLYYYGKPQQLETDRLFGSESGDASHYQKNFVIDPNGQISASYLDQEGRVIATSLVGDPGIGLSALPSAAGATVPLTSDLFNRDANGQSILNVVNINGTSIEFNSQLLVGYMGTYDFSYNLIIDTLYDPCLVANICFNCVYDLKIKVMDECGVIQAEYNQTIGHFDYDNDGHIALVFNCANPSEFNYDTSFSLILNPGNYTISKILTINAGAEDTFIHAYLNPDFNSCVLTLEDFVKNALAHLDTASCHITCESCIQGLGSRDSFVALGYGSALKYDFLVEECKKPCQSTSWCEANYQAMLIDVSPDGQYGEYHDTSWVINPGLFPLSVFNDQSNHLPGAVDLAHPANWRHPYIILFGLPHNSYVDDDGDSSIILLSGNPGSSFSPELADPTLYYFSIENNSYYTYPQNLKHLADFIQAWKPSWARSLLKYHPEYCYYENCKASAVVTSGDIMSSDDFDALLENTTTYADGVLKHLIKSPPLPTNPIDRITQWWNPANLVSDPFMVHPGPNDNYSSQLHTRMLHYATVSNQNLDIVAYAAYLTRCEGIPNQYIVNPSCTGFGDFILNQSLTDSLRNKEWTILKALYLGLKREFQFMRANAAAISCGGYNGCIGEADWSPFGTPMVTNCNPLNSCPFYSSNTQTQPCSQSVYQYYWDKQKRFMDPVQLPPEISDPQQIAYQNYVLTGQCPLAAAFQNLLSELAFGGNLNTANYSLNNSPAFTGFYQYLNSTLPGLSNVYTWSGTQVGDDVISFVIKKDIATIYQGTLDKNGANIFWDDIKIFSDLHVYSFSGIISYFTVKAGVYTQPNSLSPYQYYLFSNSSTNNINLDIFNCAFTPVATANEFAVDLSILMSALATNHKLLNTNLSLHPNYDTYISASILNWLGVADASSLVWKYSSALSRFEINAPANKSIYIYITGFEPSNFLIANLANVAYFNNMSCDNYNYFRVNGYNTPNHLYVVTKGYVVLMSNGVETPISTGSVSLPVSVKCNDPVYQTTTSFFQVVTDILLNQDLNTFENFFGDPYMTTELATLFYPDNQTTGEYITDIDDPYFYDTLKFSGTCPLTLTHSNTLDPAYYMNDIIKVIDIVLTGTPDDQGNYHSFYMIVQFPSTILPVIDTVFGSVCIPLRLCECDDSTGIPIIPTESSSSSSSDSTLAEQTPYLTEVSGAKSISDVDSSYAKYTSAVELVNSEIVVEQSDTITPLSQNDFFAGGFAYSTENYKKFTDHFHPEIDSVQYAKDILSFVLDYGNNTRADKEYDRYSGAVKYYNEYAQLNGLTALTILSDSEFYNGLYADTIYSYIDYLITSVKNNEEAVSVTEFYQTNSSGLSYDDCEGEYKSYSNAWLFFSTRQKQNLTCPKWEVISPLVSYESFLKANLCCSQLGQSILQTYIQSLYDTTQCPGPMPSLSRCDTTAEAKQASASDCQSYYQDYVNLVNQYNVSYYATITAHYLTVYYNTFDAFVAAGLCDCYANYSRYLAPYLFTSNLQLTAPDAIAVYCKIVDDTPDPCVSAYNDYSVAVNSYNAFAIQYRYPVAPVYSYGEMIRNGYCDCINGFIKFLQNIQLHFILDYPMLKGDIDNYFANCEATLIPPCPANLPLGLYQNSTFPIDSDPCIAQLISIAVFNATNDYNNYRDSLMGVIANNYVSHCMHAFEKFDATYDFKEYHFTLYYYDQAGNLVKTVPPEGVETIGVTSSYNPLEEQIIADRTFHTHTVFTSHRLYTIYDYNSLNQLVKQSLPDHDKMDIFDPEVPFGINPDVKVTAIQFVSESRGYLSGYIDVSPKLRRGYFYTTTDGGHTWRFNSTVPGSNLKKIAWRTTTEGYAVGSDGTFIKTVDGGQNWDLMNTYLYGNNAGIYDFNDLYINNTTIYVAGKHGVILKFTSNTSTYTSVNASQLTTDEITSITYDGTYLYFTAIENYPGVYPAQGGKILYLNLSNLSNGTATLHPNWPLKISYYNNGNAFAVGLEGAIEKRVHVGNADYWVAIPSKLKRNFLDIDFITDNIGVALVDSLNLLYPHHGQVYKTLDGGINWKLISDSGKYYGSMYVFNTSSAIHKVVFAGKYGDLLKVSYFPDSAFGLIKLKKVGTEISAVWATEHGNSLLVLAGDKWGNIFYNTNANYLSSSWGMWNYAFTHKIIAIAAKDFYGNGHFNVSGTVVTEVVSPDTVNAYGFNFQPPTNLTNATVLGAYVTDAAIDLYNNNNRGILFSDNVNSATGRRFRKFTVQAGAPPANPTNLLQSGLPLASYYHLGTYNSTVVASGFVSNEIGNFIKGTVSGSSITTIKESFRSLPLHDAEGRYDLGSRVAYCAGDDASIYMLTTDIDPTLFIQLGASSTSNINAIKVTDAKHGYIVNDSGAVCSFHWNASITDFALTVVDAAAHQPLYDIALYGTYPDFKAYAVGANGTIRYSPTIGSVGFTNLLITNPVNLHGVTFDLNGVNAWIVGDHSRIHEADSVSQMQIPNVFLPAIQSFNFIDEDNGYLVSDSFNIRQTHDAGGTWNIAIPSSSIGTSYPRLLKIKSRNSNFAYVAGLTRKYYEVTNLQATFHSLTLPAPISSGADILDLGLSSSDHSLKYMLVRNGSSNSSNGYFLQNSGGYTWSTLKPYSGKNPRSLWVFRNDNVILAGTHSLLDFYDVANGFTPVYPTGASFPTDITLNAVAFYDDINGYVAGENGFLIKSKDWKFDTYPFAIHTGTWERKRMSNNLNNQSDSTKITFNAIGTAGRFWLMTGGSYNGLPVGYCRITHDESIVYSTRFWYDRIGRLILSQNTKQFNQNPRQYSYTLYDGLGRITEAGVKHENTSPDPQFTSIFGAWVSSYYNPTVINDANLNAWISSEATTSRTEVTRTFYDNPLAGLSIPDFTQDNLRKRIASVTYSDLYKTDPLDYNSASHYSYDIHGNVKSLVQDNKMLSADIADQRFKRLDYDYDLISGKVNEVKYEEGKADEWDHRYTYDADNRIKTAETTDNQVLWDQDAKYFYYQNGPLARTEIGNNQVQGIDYAYTLQGWIKGINSTALDSSRDIGQDGLPDSVNAQFAPDAFSYSLGYFANDYKPIDATHKWNNVPSRFISNPSGSQSSQLLDSRNDLFNGNISYMMTTIAAPVTDQKLPQATAYKYDQLNRLLEERAFVNLNTETNEWDPGDPVNYNGRYHNQFTYDANGNITHQGRHDINGTAIENLTYNYFNDGSGKVLQNRLYTVNDDVDPNAYPDDIDDQVPFDNSAEFVNARNNYGYTELGELKKDSAEEITSIIWRTDGKIKEVNRKSGSSKKNLKFEYDPMGNRSAKHIYESNGTTWDYSTYYVRDAQGNIMATYSKTADPQTQTLSYKLIERYIYGSSRVGLFNDTIEMIDAALDPNLRDHYLRKREYEGVNHLGNVLTVFTDRKIPLDVNSDNTVDGFKADLLVSQDYYPGGTLMLGRNFSLTAFNFGYQGSLKDDELKGLGNSYTTEFRELDVRLARWFSLDPKITKYPGWSPYNLNFDNPILIYDPTGADSAQRAKAVEKAKKYTDNNAGYKMGAKGQPGEKVDCSGLVSSCVKEGGEKDPNHGDKSSGVLNIQNNLPQVAQNNIQSGNIVTFYFPNYDYKYHTGLIIDVKKDKSNNVIGFTMAESNGSQGQVPTEVTIGTGGYGTHIEGFYKWDTKPDKPALKVTSDKQTQSQSKDGFWTTLGKSIDHGIMQAEDFVWGWLYKKYFQK